MTADNRETDHQSWDVDEVMEELGMGQFQVMIFILIGFILMFSNISPLSFALTAEDLDYRCYVPTCDVENDRTYKPDWLINAVPFDSDSERPMKCLRYRPKNETTRSLNNCTGDLFTTIEEPCDRWVFATNHNTIGKEFGIMCEDRKWQLTLVGTANTIGQYIGICLFGILADSYGRKFITLLCILVSTVFGLAGAFSNGYIMFIIFEFLDALFSSGIYGAAFVLGLEFMTPKMRSITTATVSVFYPFGAVGMGIVAWWVHDWRKLLIICYVPGLLFIFYYWLIPESARWLEINGRHEEAVEVIKYISKKNKRPLPVKMLAKIEYSQRDYKENQVYTTSTWITLKTALKSKLLLFRTLACSYCWFTFTLIYYGLSINSVELVGGSYQNFILVNLIEVPAFICSSIVMMKYRRKPIQIITLTLSGLACIVCELVPTKEAYVQITLFLLSKFLISLSFLVFYVYAAEMFPTEVRMSLYGVSSLLGRTGTILAPQTILLKQYLGPKAPVMLFGGISIIGGLISTIFPETFEKKLPETLKDIKNLK